MSAPKVTLRDVTQEDSDRLLAWRNMPEVSAWMYSDHVITPAEHGRWFEVAMQAPSRRYWIIEMDGLPVGLANLADIDHAHRKCAWAYYLADPAVRGKGVGSFVEFWMIEHVFAGLGLNKLWCEVLIGNEPVWKLHESYGFVREALFRAHVWKHGQPTDVVGLGLLAADWAQRRADRLARLKDKGFDVAAWDG
jgi:UDP-4-amino-4,6-dideoxy-N-acetyl-beta-L-altrosamine N-acetyltransferase